MGDCAARLMMAILQYVRYTHLLFIKKTLARFQEWFPYLPGSLMAEGFTDQCCMSSPHAVACQEHHHHWSHQIQQSSWHNLVVDTVEPYAMSQGTRFIISLIDCFLKCNTLMPVTKHRRYCGPLVDGSGYNVFWCPCEAPNTSGSKFIVALWENLQQLLGCSVVHISPYHPKKMEIIEQAPQTINNLLHAKHTKLANTHWEDPFPAVGPPLHTPVGHFIPSFTVEW